MLQSLTEILFCFVFFFWNIWLVCLFVCLHTCSFVKEFCRVLLQFSLDQSPWGLGVGLIELCGVRGWGGSRTSWGVKK